jgi:hypothetical protein
MEWLLISAIANADLTRVEIARHHPPFGVANQFSSTRRSQELANDLAFTLRCLNRHSFNLALMKYVDFRGYLITGQHSGTHWIKWMLSNVIAHHYGVPPP